MSKEPFWEESYRRGGRLDTFGGGKPSPDVVSAAAGLQPRSRVLDLGCGEGRNAIYLASLGHRTHASDISEAGIAKLRSVAVGTGIEVEAVTCDMREYELPYRLDLIVCQGCLHLIPRPDWQAMIQRMKQATVIGGQNVVGVFTDTVPEPPDQEGLMVGLFREGELEEQYSDWVIIDSTSRVFKHEHPDGPRHRHAANALTSRKPGPGRPPA